MDIKKKREIVIYVSMAAGLGMPLLALFFSLIETLFIDFHRTQILFSDILFYSSTYFSRKITQLAFSPNKSSVLVIIPLFLTCQCMIYAFGGWIIARLIYPNRKASPDPDKATEPIQD